MLTAMTLIVMLVMEMVMVVVMVMATAMVVVLMVTAMVMVTMVVMMVFVAGMGMVMMARAMVPMVVVMIMVMVIGTVVMMAVILNEPRIASAGCAHPFFVFMHLALRSTRLCSSAAQDKPLQRIFRAVSPIVSDPAGARNPERCAVSSLHSGLALEG